MSIGEDYDMTRVLTLEFLRLPDRPVSWRQWKIHQDEEVLVSSFYDPHLKRPVTIDSEVVVDDKMAGITYNFWDKWFNVIRIYGRDLEFKGFYTDIITPIQKTWTLVTATDLFLDLFMFPDGRWTVQDEDEFEDAVETGIMDEGIAANARRALEEVVDRARSGDWPPECVKRIPSDPVREVRQAIRLGLMGK